MSDGETGTLDPQLAVLAEKQLRGADWNREEAGVLSFLIRRRPEPDDNAEPSVPAA